LLTLSLTLSRPFSRHEKPPEVRKAPNDPNVSDRTILGSSSALEVKHQTAGTDVSAKLRDQLGYGRLKTEPRIDN
jgi:hypothetical protein